MESIILKIRAEVFKPVIISFGRQYVGDYKTRKMNHGVNLEKDEKARRGDSLKSIKIN